MEINLGYPHGGQEAEQHPFGGQEAEETPL